MPAQPSSLGLITMCSGFGVMQILQGGTFMAYQPVSVSRSQACTSWHAHTQKDVLYETEEGVILTDEE